MAMGSLKIGKNSMVFFGGGFLFLFLPWLLRLTTSSLFCWEDRQTSYYWWDSWIDCVLLFLCWCTTVVKRCSVGTYRNHYHIQEKVIFLKINSWTMEKNWKTEHLWARLLLGVVTRGGNWEQAPKCPVYWIALPPSFSVSFISASKHAKVALCKTMMWNWLEFLHTWVICLPFSALVLYAVQTQIIKLLYWC